MLYSLRNRNVRLLGPAPERRKELRHAQYPVLSRMYWDVLLVRKFRRRGIRLRARVLRHDRKRIR